MKSETFTVDGNHDKERLIVWLGFLMIAIILGSTFRAGQLREEAREKYMREQIVTAKGTVLNADCSFDPKSGKVSCTELVVIYPNGFGVDETRTFAFEGTITTTKNIPNIGSTVLVGWNKKTPDNAYVMSS